MLMAFDPSLLPTFLAVVESGRISVAAKGLSLSQPAVTAQIHKLEESLGAPLFTRSARGVTLTSAGERLKVYARSIQQLVDEASEAVGSKEDVTGELALAASTTIAAHVLPGLLASFRKAHPGVGLRLEVGNTDVVLGRVIEGGVPLGLVEGHARAAGVRLEPFVDDELVAVVARGSSFRLRSVEDFATVPILWREPGSGTRSVLERAWLRAGIRRRPLPIDLVLGSTESILGAVGADLGAAFVSRWSVQTHLAAGHVILVPGLDFVVHRTFHWALPARGLSGAASRFFAFAQRTPPSLRGRARPDGPRSTHRLL
jgi:DNA-binding transcriptional LysR family regulator